MRSRHVIVLLALAMAMSSCTCARRAPTVTRTKLATLPQTFRSRSLIVADSATDVAYVEKNADSSRVVHRAEAGPAFPIVTPPVLSPSGDRVFYWAQTTVAGTTVVYLVADGQQITAPVAAAGGIVTSPVGKRWAAVGGTARPAASGEGEEAGPVLLWVDGQPSVEYADMSLPTFSRDGAHLAFLADVGGGRVALMVDGVEQRVFAAPVGPATPIRRAIPGPNLVRQFAIGYLSDGQLLLLTTDRNGWSIYRGEHRLASYPRNADHRASDGPLVIDSALADAAAIVPHSLKTAHDTPVAAWWARDQGDPPVWRVVRDGVPESQACTQPLRDDSPVLSADGRHLAYACHTQAEGQPDQVLVVHDGQHFGPYADVFGVALSADGQRLAYIISDGSPERPWSYLVDGKRHRLKFDEAYPPRFSADGRHVAWVAQRNRGSAGPKLILFLDGNSYASSDQLIFAPTFALGTNRLTWVAQRGRNISRIEVVD